MLVFGSLTGALAAQKTDSANTLPSRSSYDMVVFGGTPGGVACAVRAAREGLSVLLVSGVEHIGGMPANGLGILDTRYNGTRGPLYDELRQSIYDHYRTTYGPDSEQYLRSAPGQPKTKYEPHLMERLFGAMVSREPRVELVRGWMPAKADVSPPRMRSVSFRDIGSERAFTVSAFAFADCSYEGDLLALAGVPYRVGRESRDELKEEHAGRIFMARPVWPSPLTVDADQLAGFHRLNVVQYYSWFEIIRPESDGVGDRSVQAYSLRPILTRNPANRIPIEAPKGYDRELVLRRLQTDTEWSFERVPRPVLPNLKAIMLRPELVGVQNAYPEGDAATRRRIHEEHIFMFLSLMYFAQNDSSVSPELRAEWREWGLPRDEFVDNGHLPYEIYVRESRRLEGRAMYTQHDSTRAPGLKRAPIYADSVTFADWFLDSHACTPVRVKGGNWEGTIGQLTLTVPGQVSFRTMLPKGLDNFLVPGCASASHVGWGAIRLEPVWMCLGEAAAHAVTMARRQGITPAAINSDELVRLLTDRRFTVTFFNDIEVNPSEKWYSAVQYLGTQGFFATYEARPLDVLTAGVADAWSQAAAEWASGKPVDPNERARRMLAAEAGDAQGLRVDGFTARLAAAFAKVSLPIDPKSLLERANLAIDMRLSRGDACRIIMLAKPKPAVRAPSS